MAPIVSLVKSGTIFYTNISPGFYVSPGYITKTATNQFFELVQNITQQIEVTPCHCFCNEFKLWGQELL